mmetsp:Transcript_10881/g.23218  ORF Transcript_10881/g.23218 Transcript_10881/m.23218 type:complete len:1155 (+) Transcript_10881:86-3550(+)
MDATKVVAAVDKTYADIQSVKTRMMGVTGTLNQLKVAVSTALPTDSSKDQQINVAFVRQELARAKSAVAKFKDLISQAVDNDVATGPGGRRQVKDDKSRTLYERVGGDLNIETCSEIIYNKSLTDTRVRSFFEKNQRKMQQIRKKVFQFLSGFLGGPKLYDTANLKPSHYHMNIMDYHFDALVDIYTDAMTELGIHPDAAKDFAAALGRIRKDITTGCTVRMELAQKNMEKGKDGLFKRLGGEAGIAQFVGRSYDLIAVDTRLKPYFVGKSFDAIKEGTQVYLTELLGGPKIYKGRDLGEIHTGLGVSDYEFDCFLAGVEKALGGLGIEDETIDEVIVTMEPARSALLKRKRGLAARAKIVNGETVLERLGGEMNVEAIVDTMFVGCVGDPRLTFFFEGRRDRLDAIKRNFQALIIGGFGGPVTYEEGRCRKAHYQLNCTDYHVDAMLENFYCACELMDAPHAVIADAIDVLGPVRQDVTAGCTVRLEVARKKTESAGTDGLFESLGKEDGIQLCVDKHFELLQVDSRVKHYFIGSRLVTMKSAVKQYICALLGAPVEYTGRPLDRIHSTMAMSDFEFDSFLECFKNALRSVGSDAQNVDECVVMLELVRKDVLVNRKSHDVRKIQEAASAKSIFERLGGEVGVSSMVDSMYSQALVDVRVRSFFEKNKAKMTSMKKKLLQFMSGYFGGTSTYDMSDIRPMHYNWNISDYHFDCMLSIIRMAMVDGGAKPRDISDALLALQPTRADVTTGFVVRMEMARKNVEKGKDQLFKRLGGTEGVTGLMDALFNISLADARIKAFLQKDPDRIKAAQTVFIVEMLGGPKAYKGRDLGSVHKSLNINDYHYDSYIGNLTRAMMGAGHPESLIDEVMVTLEPGRCDVLGNREGADPSLHREGLEPLIVRFGGDMNLEAVVETMFDRCCADSRVMFHFERAKSKQRQIRRKFCNYFTGAFGGAVTYDAKELRPAHYGLNITDYHFDVSSELFSRAALHMQVDREAVADAMLVMNRVRADITTGCTVRMELAKKKNELDGMDQLFSRLGGLDGVMAIIDRLYECLERDKRVNMFFEGTKIQSLKQSATDYIIMILGGPADYKGRSLSDIHSVLQMTDYHLDCYLQNTARAMRDVGCDSDAVDEAVVVLEILRKQVLHAHYAKVK